MLKREGTRRGRERGREGGREGGRKGQGEGGREKVSTVSNKMTLILLVEVFNE